MSENSPDRDSTDSFGRFADFGLSAPLLTALDEAGYETPTPIQAACIPHLLAGRDVVGQAQTGTGKTAAFALPLLQRLDMSQTLPQVLVLTPTRELAIQVAEAFQTYARHVPGFHVLPVYGGQGMGNQLRSLRRTVHVIVGTPGRVMDHLRRETLSLAGITAVVLDEGDEMLRMGFIDDVEWILEHAPAQRQVALFSATMPEQIRKVARRHLKDPQELKIRSKTSTVALVRQRYWQVSGLHKLDALTRILEVEEIDAALIFVRTKTATVELAEKLEARGYPSSALNGDMNQLQRERTVEQLKNKKLDIVIATDVAARGLDVPRISHVINYDIPYDVEGYIHRIGRTGRAGRTGDAILFVSPREIRMLRAIERATNQPIEPMQPPSREAIAGKRVAQFKQQITDVLAADDLGFFRQIVSEMAEEAQFDAADIAAALAFLVQKDRPLQLAMKDMAQETAYSPAPRSADRADRSERKPYASRARSPEGGPYGDAARSVAAREQTARPPADPRSHARDDAHTNERASEFAGPPASAGFPAAGQTDDAGAQIAPRRARSAFVAPRDAPAWEQRPPRVDAAPDDAGQREATSEQTALGVVAHSERVALNDAHAVEPAPRTPRRARSESIDESPRHAVDEPATEAREREPSNRDPRTVRRRTAVGGGVGGGGAQRLPDFPDIEMIRYRIAVGREQGVQPKNIVGAIANEADMDSRYIGRIDLYDNFSTVDLPAGMPPELLSHLRRARIGKFMLDIAPFDGITPRGERRPPSADTRPPRVDDGRPPGAFGASSARTEDRPHWAPPAPGAPRPFSSDVPSARSVVRPTRDGARPTRDGARPTRDGARPTRDARARPGSAAGAARGPAAPRTPRPELKLGERRVRAPVAGKSGAAPADTRKKQSWSKKPKGR